MLFRKKIAAFPLAASFFHLLAFIAFMMYSVGSISTHKLAFALSMLHLIACHSLIMTSLLLTTKYGLYTYLMSLLSVISTSILGIIWTSFKVATIPKRYELVVEVCTLIIWFLATFCSIGVLTSIDTEKPFEEPEKLDSGHENIEYSPFERIVHHSTIAASETSSNFHERINLYCSDDFGRLDLGSCMDRVIHERISRETSNNWQRNISEPFQNESEPSVNREIVELESEQEYNLESSGTSQSETTIDDDTLVHENAALNSPGR